MEKLEQKIGYAFRDKSLLRTALTHSSYANERHGVECNERLEFLGDSILGFAVAEYLYKNNPDMPEGRMTRLRAELVCEKSLFEAAKSIDLGEYLLLGRGELSNGGRARPSLLADAMEAVFAAVFLDGGRRTVTRIIRKLILSRAAEAERANFDYKTALQERAQKKPGAAVKYRLDGESGPDHLKLFRVEVTLGGRSLGFGEGNSKKSAEQAAARAALAVLDE
ncbi:MAG: ribonuclease III [Oscillospiraceae bacterium]|jgi:ribonuclease-3|nr:ribonuclease III [Oscillospiraceae bacterium]